MVKNNKWLVKVLNFCQTIFLASKNNMLKHKRQHPSGLVLNLAHKLIDYHFNRFVLKISTNVIIN